MSPFRRGAHWSLYVPRRSGGAVQRACGTTDAKLARAMGRMVETLADLRRWDVLDALDAKTITVGQCYDAFVMNRLDHLLHEVSAVDLADLVEPWLATLAKKPATVAQYRYKLARLIPGPLMAHAVHEGWLIDLLATQPVSGTTKGIDLGVLALFFDYCYAKKALTSNPARNRSLVKRPRTNPPRKVWKTVADDLKLVNAAPEPFRSYFALVHATGADRDSALNMTRSDVNTTTWTVHIPGTKRATRDRAGVPVEAWAHPILLRHMKGMMPDAPLFPGLRRTVVNYAHRDAREAAKLTGYQLRDARHSYAVRAILRGEPLWKVSKWMGHANEKTTATIYTQFELADALAMLATDAKQAQR